MKALKYTKNLKIQVQLRNEKGLIPSDVYSNIYFTTCFLAIQFNRNDFYQCHHFNVINRRFA